MTAGSPWSSYNHYTLILTGLHSWNARFTTRTVCSWPSPRSVTPNSCLPRQLPDPQRNGSRQIHGLVTWQKLPKLGNPPVIHSGVQHAVHTHRNRTSYKPGVVKEKVAVIVLVQWCVHVLDGGTGTVIPPPSCQRYNHKCGNITDNIKQGHY